MMRARRPMTVLWPIPVALSARIKLLKMRLKSRGDSLSPYFWPRMRWVQADLP